MPKELVEKVTLRPPVCAVDPRRILDVMGSTHGAHVSRLESLSRERCIMSSMRHESDLVLREDSLTEATTGVDQLCKSAVKQTLRKFTTSRCVNRKSSVSNGWQTRSSAA